MTPQNNSTPQRQSQLVSDLQEPLNKLDVTLSKLMLDRTGHGVVQGAMTDFVKSLQAAVETSDRELASRDARIASLEAAVQTATADAGPAEQPRAR